MPSSTSSTVLLAGSALLVAAAAAALFPSGTKSASDSREIAEIDEGHEDGDYITEEDVVKVFDALFMHMQGVLAQISQQISQIQQMGQQIPEAQLRQLLKGEFERNLVSKQKQLYEERDVDEDCFEEATWEFLDQPDLYPNAKKSVERFQKLWENVSGESVVGKRPGKVSSDDKESQEIIEILSPEKLLEAAEAHFGAASQAMRSIVNRYKEEGKDLNSQETAQQLNLEFVSAVEGATKEALAKHGCTSTQFQKSLEAHMDKPQVGRALAMLQMKQQQDMMSLGLPGM